MHCFDREIQFNVLHAMCWQGPGCRPTPHVEAAQIMAAIDHKRDVANISYMMVTPRNSPYRQGAAMYARAFMGMTMQEMMECIDSPPVLWPNFAPLHDAHVSEYHRVTALIENLIVSAHRDWDARLRAPIGL